jgi:hypothetical protein
LEAVSASTLLPPSHLIDCFRQFWEVVHTQKSRDCPYFWTGSTGFDAGITSGDTLTRLGPLGGLVSWWTWTWGLFTVNGLGILECEKLIFRDWFFNCSLNNGLLYLVIVSN